MYVFTLFRFLRSFRLAEVYKAHECLHSGMEHTHGKLLRNLRRKANLTQGELGEAVGLTGHAIGYRERGSTEVHPSEYAAFAKALGVDVSVFESGSGEVLPMPKPDQRLVKLVGAIPAGWSRLVVQHLGGDYVISSNVEGADVWACIVSGRAMEPLLREGDVLVFRNVLHDARAADDKVVCLEVEGGSLEIGRLKVVSDKVLTLSQDNSKAGKPRRINLGADPLTRLGVCVQRIQSWT
jgi:transcriptional regulator with XRE-family HTH domain